MPAPSRTSLDGIVTAGRDLVAREGVDGLTMHSVASAVGVRAPSLYKHVGSRAELVRLVTVAIAREVRALMDEATGTGAAVDDLRALGVALRAFARRDPHSFAALFSPLPEARSLDPEVYADTAAPVVEVAGRIAGPAHALDAARTVTAWAIGFLTMELAGAFHLGGSVDDAFDYGLDAMAAALGALANPGAPV